jgi:hypothetical protein
MENGPHVFAGEAFHITSGPAFVELSLSSRSFPQSTDFSCADREASEAREARGSKEGFLILPNYLPGTAAIKKSEQEKA